MPIKRSMKAEFGTSAPAKIQNPLKVKPSSMTSDKENEKVRKEMAKIDAMDLSDIESPEWELAKQKHVQASLKRQRDVENAENDKRKVRKAMPLQQNASRN